MTNASYIPEEWNSVTFTKTYNQRRWNGSQERWEDEHYLSAMSTGASAGPDQEWLTNGGLRALKVWSKAAEPERPPVMPMLKDGRLQEGWCPSWTRRPCSCSTKKSRSLLDLRVHCMMGKSMELSWKEENGLQKSSCHKSISNSFFNVRKKTTWY